MIVNCQDFLVLPSTTQWNGMISRLDIVAEKLDSLHEGVNTRLDNITTRLNSMESNMNTRFDRLEMNINNQLMAVITQLTETNSRLAETNSRLAETISRSTDVGDKLSADGRCHVDQKLVKSDMKFEAIVRTGRKIEAVQFRRDLENLFSVTYV
ncbi:hypothetical protein E4U45_007923 [Claviceps purpurea]|nr:hypothetical protein E4U45_007923 [Claviceps purpurea]